MFKRYVKLLVLIIIANAILSGCMSETSAPKATLEIRIHKEKQTEFIKTLHAFAAEQGFNVKDGGKEWASNKNYKIVFLKLENSDGVVIYVTDLRDGERFSIAIHQQSNGDQWMSIWSDLMVKLKINQ